MTNRPSDGDPYVDIVEAHLSRGGKPQTGSPGLKLSPPETVTSLKWKCGFPAMRLIMYPS